MNEFDPPLKKKIILVVDDDHSIVRMLQEALEQEGYDVICGYDGQMAIQLARTRKPDLIILDVEMPMTNGLATLKSLRQMSETKSIPVIVSTGVMSSQVYPLVEQNTRVAHLKKPVDLDNMRSMIQLFLTKYPIVS
jgi:two-component system cell cycle response regulator DivK